MKLKTILRNLFAMTAGTIAGAIIAVSVISFGLTLLKHKNDDINLLSIRAYVVQSGSMEPNIMTGSLIFTYPKKNYKVGDVITFQPGEQKQLVTHRIISANGNGELATFQTKGDANEDPDHWEIPANNVKGNVVFNIPYVGRLAAFAQKPQGFIALVIIPSTIIVYEELRSVFVEITSKIKKRREKYDRSGGETRRGINKALVFVPAVGALLVVAAFTGSYFMDNEISINNILGVATDYEQQPPEPSTSPNPSPTSQPPTILINEVFANGVSSEEWVELYNPNNFSVEISNWYIADSANEDVIPENITLPPFGYGVLIGSTSTKSSSIPSSAVTIILYNSTIGSGLNDSGDSVSLAIKTDTNVIVDEMNYGNELNDDVSLARIPNGTDTNTAADWQIDDSPTIGEENNL